MAQRAAPPEWQWAYSSQTCGLTDSLLMALVGCVIAVVNGPYIAVRETQDTCRDVPV